MVLIPIDILDGFSCYISRDYEHVILVLGIVDGILFQEGLMNAKDGFSKNNRDMENDIAGNGDGKEYCARWKGLGRKIFRWAILMGMEKARNYL